MVQFSKEIRVLSEDSKGISGALVRASFLIIGPTMLSLYPKGRMANGSGMGLAKGWRQMANLSSRSFLEAPKVEELISLFMALGNGVV